MFGYIVINEPALRVRELSLYRSYYCGLCEELHSGYGRAAQLVLNYDTTFLAILLSSLYEPADEEQSEAVCLPHPLKKHPLRRNLYTRYTAAVTVLLSVSSFQDDWKDEKKVSRLAMSGILNRAFQSAARKYPAKAQAVRFWLDRLGELEKKGSQAVTPDEAGGCFGRLMAELFAPHCDEWEGCLREIGFYLGKFIYLLDAYDDLDRDEEKGCFNPLLPVRSRLEAVSAPACSAKNSSCGTLADPDSRPLEAPGDTLSAPGSRPLAAPGGTLSAPGGTLADPDSPQALSGGLPEPEAADHPFDDHVRALLNMLMGSCCRAFEILPIVENADILRNILYSGVWTRFEAVYAARTKTAGRGSTDHVRSV